MVEIPLKTGPQSPTSRAALVLVAAVALAAGLYGRFKGIGLWPLGVDEFYISRSIDNVLRSGLPRFTCGGYYTRGVLFQYTVAGLRHFGATPEFAGRMVAGLSSLALLPAAYLIAKRVAGSLAGWLTVIMLCLSIWEIEMARFGRMYAPFQAVFGWYVVFFLRYTTTRRAVDLGWMIALSVLGVLTWEGGALLGVATLLAIVLTHQQGRLRASDWPRLVVSLAALGLLFLATRDLRGFADAPSSEPADAVQGGGHLQVLLDWFEPLRQHPLALLGLLVPLAIAVRAVPWLWAERRRWMASVGLCAALAAAAVHLFSACLGVLVLLLATRLIDARQLAARPARAYAASLLGFLVFWLAFEHWVGGAPPTAMLHALFGFPDVFDQVVRPWGRTLPILSVGLSLGVGYWCYRTFATHGEKPDAPAALLSLVLALMLAVGAIATERVETRYTFFLYPLLLVLAVAAILTYARRQAWLPLCVTAALPLVCFAGTEDFQPRHLARIDSPQVNFRLGMSAVRAAHYYPRNDMRAVADWLAAHRVSGDAVVSGIPSLDQYYPGFDYFYLDDDDPRYDAYVCSDGKSERWTNHSIVYTSHSLKAVVQSHRRVLATVYPDTAEHLRAVAPAEGWVVKTLWTDEHGGNDVLLIVAAPGTPDAP